jgi:DNA repair exonuclease SbcCD ATPase subunit
MTMPPDAAHLVADLAALEEELARAQSRLHAGQQEIEELEKRKAETQGSVILAERAISDLERRLAEQREVLARRQRLEEARDRLAQAIADRDAAATRLAATAEALMVQLDELSALGDTVTTAQQAVQAAGDRRTLELPGEPAELRDAWNRLIERIRTQLGSQLEHELLEAAARSPFGNAIRDLPAHLRAAARERRAALHHQSVPAKDEDRA